MRLSHRMRSLLIEGVTLLLSAPTAPSAGLDADSPNSPCNSGISDSHCDAEGPSSSHSGVPTTSSNKAYPSAPHVLGNDAISVFPTRKRSRRTQNNAL